MELLRAGPGLRRRPLSYGCRRTGEAIPFARRFHPGNAARLARVEILFFPGGAVYPIASFPGWLKGFAKVNPEAYAVDALKSILFKGGGPASVTHDLLFLALFTAVMMILAILTFKRTL